MSIAIPVRTRVRCEKMLKLVAVLEKLTHKNAGLMVSLRALIVPVLAAARAGGSASFLHGDALPMMRRVQHSGQRTEWSEVPHRIAPRFGVDRTVLLEALPADHPDTEPYKVSLALLGLEFTTPWITLSDGSGRYLERLDLSRSLNCSGPNAGAAYSCPSVVPYLESTESGMGL